MNIPQKKDKVLTGYGDKLLDNPVFREVMGYCNDAADKSKFVPMRDQEKVEPIKDKGKKIEGEK